MSPGTFHRHRTRGPKSIRHRPGSRLQTPPPGRAGRHRTARAETSDRPADTAVYRGQTRRRVQLGAGAFVAWPPEVLEDAVGGVLDAIDFFRIVPTLVANPRSRRFQGETRTATGVAIRRRRSVARCRTPGRRSSHWRRDSRWHPRASRYSRRDSAWRPSPRVDDPGLLHLVVQLRHLRRPRARISADPGAVLCSERRRVQCHQGRDFVAVEVGVRLEGLRHLKLRDVGQLGGRIPGGHGGEHIGVTQRQGKGPEA